MATTEASRLTLLKRRWLALGRFIGNLIARIFLTVFYFVVLAPFAIAARLFSDLLKLKPPSGDLWQDRADEEHDLETARQQG